MRGLTSIAAAVALAALTLGAAATEPVEIVPRSGRQFKVVKFSSLPAYEPNRLPDGRPEELTIREIAAELRMVTTSDLMGSGLISCDFLGGRRLHSPCLRWN